MRLNPVLVTRPLQEAQGWAQQLRQAGRPAEVLPLISIAPPVDAAAVQALHQAWQTLDHYAACFFVSGHAVNYFFSANRAAGREFNGQGATNNVATDPRIYWAAGLRFMAPGPGTAAALRAAGVPDAQIDAPAADALQFDSQALWQAVRHYDWRGRKVFIVRGEDVRSEGAAGDDDPQGHGNPPPQASPKTTVPAATTTTPAGRDWIARQWQAAGAQVDLLSVYVRRPAEWTAAQFERARAASHDHSIWLFSSSQALDYLLARLPDVDWRHARAIATHPRIASRVRAAGWGVVAQARPALPEIVAALGSIESRFPSHLP